MSINHHELNLHFFRTYILEYSIVWNPYSQHFLLSSESSVSSKGTRAAQIESLKPGYKHLPKQKFTTTQLP